MTQQQIDLAKQSDSRSQQLYNLTEPGIGLAENFYKSLASGDPSKLQQATAPATEQIAKSYQAAKENIMDNTPRGGAKDLALEQTDISKAGAIGSTQANAFLSSFPALASLGGQGVGLSINEVTQALSAFSGASSSNQAAGQMEGAGKAQTLGFLGSLGQSAAMGAGTALGCWIAEVVFGKTNIRTARMRVFLNDVWGLTLSGRIVMPLYRRFGMRVARQAEKRDWLRNVFTWIFNYADQRAYLWELSLVERYRQAGVM